MAANRLSLVKIEPSVQSFAPSPSSSSSSSLLSWSPYLTLSSVSPLAHPNQATFRLHVSFFLATHSSLSLFTSNFSPHVGWEAMRKPEEAEAIGCEGGWRSVDSEVEAILDSADVEANGKLLCGLETNGEVGLVLV